jgi:hypothetical protein
VPPLKVGVGSCELFAQAGLKPLSSQSPLPSIWDYRHEPLYLAAFLFSLPLFSSAVVCSSQLLGCRCDTSSEKQNVLCVCVVQSLVYSHCCSSWKGARGRPYPLGFLRSPAHPPLCASSSISQCPAGAPACNSGPFWTIRASFVASAPSSSQGRWLTSPSGLRERLHFQLGVRQPSPQPWCFSFS